MTDTPFTHQKYLGLLNYEAGLTAQAEALVTLSSGRADHVLLGLEHTPVVTLGIRGRAENDLELSVEELRLNGFALHETSRGGQATLHAPGQLVIYPCVNLRAYGLGARDFVCLIQKTTLEWLGSYGVAAQAGASEPGLFVDDKKVAAFGFKIARGLTSHGLAINVSNDLASFGMIRMCGVSGQKVTRLCDLGVDADLPGLFSSWSLLFQAKLQSVREENRPMLDEDACAPLV